MFKFLLLMPLFLLAAFNRGPITKEERKFAIDYYNETKNDLEKAVKNLSTAQLNWKPADSVWSIAECIEHIALSEKNLFDVVQSSLKEPADPEKRKDVKFSDEQVIKMITDRSRKVKTREGFIPTNQFGSAEKSMDVFKERRKGNVEYIKKTEDDLRNHFVVMPFATFDTYQFLIFLSAHSKRHTLQIEEVKANPGFPKN
jgi:hypothetical protein